VIGIPIRGVTLRRYLLNQVSDRTRTRIEKGYLRDQGLFERMLLIEDQLLDDYVRGELSQVERAQFDEQFLSTPDGRQKVAAARALAEAIDERRGQSRAGIAATGTSSPSVRSWAAARWGWIAASGLVAVALVGVIVVNARLVTQLNQLESRQSSLANESQEARRAVDDQRRRADALDSAAQQQRARETALEGTVAALSDRQSIVTTVLLPGTRSLGSSQAVVTVRPNTTAVILRLVLRKTDYDRYRIVVKTVSDETEILRQEMSPPLRLDPTNPLVVTIPAGILMTDDYEVSVAGRVRDGSFEDVGTYFMRLVQR
jgi:hypothetical protein